MNANFENYARNQISSHEVDVDTDALWASIQSEVNPPAGNRKTLWFFLLGLLLGLTVFGVYYVNKDKQSLIVDQSNNSSDIGNKDMKSTAPIATKEEFENQSEDILKTEVGTTLGSNENTTTTVNNKSAIASSTSPTTTKAASTNLQTKPKQVVSRSIQNASTIVASGVSTSDGQENSIRSTLGSGDNEPNDLTPVLKEDDQDIQLLTKVVENRSLAVKGIPTLTPDHLHSEKEFPVGFLDGYKLIPGNTFAVKKKSRRRGSMFRDLKFGLGLYTGVSSAAADLEVNTPDVDEYLILRANSEKQLEALHFGISAIVETENNIYLRSGAEYTRIASLFSRASEVEVIDSIPGIVEIQINQVTGDTTEIEGMVQRTTITKFTKKSYNYFHQVDIPLILGYNFNAEDWQIGIEAGIYANILMKRKGEISLADGNFYDIDEDSSDWYKNNIGVSPFIGLNVAYNVSENIQVHFSPNFRFKSVYSTDASLIKERHASLGVHAGVRYFFDSY